MAVRPFDFRIRMSDRQFPRNVLLNVLLVASCGVGLTQSFAVSAAVQQQPPVPPALLGDKHADLLPEQNVLLDDWFRRFCEVVKKTVSLSPRILLPHKTPTATPAIRDMLNQIELNQTLRFT